MGVRLDDETRERIKAAAPKLTIAALADQTGYFGLLAQLDSLPDGHTACCRKHLPHRR